MKHLANRLSKIATVSLLLLVASTKAEATIFIFTNDSLPKTLGSGYTDDTIRFAGTSVRTAAGGLTVSAPGIFIDGQGDTLFYNSSGADFAYGITVAQTGDRVKIDRLTVYHNEDTLSNTREATCLWLANPDGVTVTRCNFVCFGYDVRCIDSYGGGTATENVVIDRCHLYNYSASYASRHSYGGAAIRLEMRGSFTGSDFGAKITASVIHISPHAGIALLGKRGFVMTPGNEISYCTTYVDHRNVGGSSANAYGILIHDCVAPLSIHHNAILSGTKYGGSRGIMLENVVGTPTNWVQIYNNRIETSSGPDQENPGGVNRVLRIRSLDGGYWDYIHVHDNYLSAKTDNLSSTKHIGTDASVFQFGAYGPDAGHANAIFERNTVVYRAMTTGTDGTAAECAVESSYPGVPPITIRHNKFLSSQRVVWTADEYNAISSHDLTFLEDTLGFLPAGDPGVLVNPVTWTVGFYAENDRRGKAVNCVYINGASDDDIRLYPNGGSHDFTLVQRKPIVARGNNDSLVATYLLRITNSQGATVLNTTVLGGVTQPDLTYLYDASTLGSPINYNPFTFVVKSGLDSTVSQRTINDLTSSIVLSLPNTRGTLPLDFVSNVLENVSSFSATLIGTDRSGEGDWVRISYRAPDNTAVDSVVLCFAPTQFPDSVALWRESRPVSAGQQVIDTVQFPIVEPGSLNISFWSRAIDGPLLGWSARGQSTVFVVDSLAPAVPTISVTN